MHFLPQIDWRDQMTFVDRGNNSCPTHCSLFCFLPQFLGTRNLFVVGLLAFGHRKLARLLRCLPNSMAKFSPKSFRKWAGKDENVGSEREREANLVYFQHKKPEEGKNEFGGIP